MKFGLCCISLHLKEQGYSFNKITYKKFQSLPREESLKILGQRIYNNLLVTDKTINFCSDKNLCYRMSSDIFPLITYENASVSLEDLPNYNQIENLFEVIKNTIKRTNVRISAHPSEFNVLASKNLKAVEKTIIELNFYSSFMDKIGCPADHSSPMNLHIHNKDGVYDEIIDRFLHNYNKLDENCKKRLVIENDDKKGGWSVRELIEKFNAKTNLPITFDYLHHKCNSDGIDEKTAFNLCYQTWNVTPLFHYSESKEGKNPRAHADYAENLFEAYENCDVDLELKMKDFAIDRYKELYDKKIKNS